MGQSSVREMLLAERQELAAVLGELSAGDWATGSLCQDWTVLDVTAHLASVVGLTRRELLTRNLRYGSGTDGANARTVRAWKARGTDRLIESLADPTRLGLGFFAPAWALCEAMVHGEDIRRPLDRSRTMAPERLEAVLPVLMKMPFLTGASRASRRVEIRATDLTWSAGKGPLVEGPAQSIMMALAGRSSAATDLTGPGLAVLLAQSTN